MLQHLRHAWESDCFKWVLFDFEIYYFGKVFILELTIFSYLLQFQVLVNCSPKGYTSIFKFCYFLKVSKKPIKVLDSRYPFFRRACVQFLVMIKESLFLGFLFLESIIHGWVHVVEENPKISSNFKKVQNLVKIRALCPKLVAS